MFKFRKDFYVKAFKEKKNLKNKKQTNKKGILLRASSHRQHNAGLIFEDEVGTTCSDLCTSYSG